MSGRGSGKNSENQGCAYGKVNREKVLNLEKSFHEFRTNDFKSLQKAVENIRDTLLKRVPWVVTVVITILTSLCVGLLVFAAVRNM